MNFLSSSLFFVNNKTSNLFKHLQEAYPCSWCFRVSCFTSKETKTELDYSLAALYKDTKHLKRGLLK